MHVIDSADRLADATNQAAVPVTGGASGAPANENRPPGQDRMGGRNLRRSRVSTGT